MESMIHASEIALFKGQIDDATTDVNQAMRDAQKGDSEAASRLGDLQATLASLRDQLGKSEKEGIIADQNLEADEQRKDETAYKKEIDEKLAQAETRRAQEEELKFLDEVGSGQGTHNVVHEAVNAPVAVAANAVAGTADVKKDEEKGAVKATTASSEAST